MAAKKKRRKRRKRNIGKHISVKGGECTYRSGWEKEYFEHLDANIDVRSYVSEGLKIPYVSNKRTGKMRNYIPDLLVTYADGRRSLIEIKPKRRLTKPTNIKKFAAARVWCTMNSCDFVILTEDHLKALGLLKK